MIHKIKEIQLDAVVLSGSIHTPLLWREFNAYYLICQVVFGLLMQGFYGRFSLPRKKLLM